MTRDPINILLVDDHPAKLLTYEAILQNLGENLIKAGSARQALEHLLKEDIAIVLSDICMPELDGRFDDYSRPLYWHSLPKTPFIPRPRSRRSKKYSFVIRCIAQMCA